MTGFVSTFEIAGREVGGSAPVLIIAEAGVSHFGDIQKAFDLVDLAADSGADIFKTQAFRTDSMISSNLPEWRERMASKEVDLEFLIRIKERCKERKIIFLCTPHDETVLPWMDTLEVPAYKIGSGERGNLPYLQRIASSKKPVILSTGMYSAKDVSAAAKALLEGGCTQAAFLHCVTSYPTPYEEVNLRAMEVIRNLFSGPVGYSDHTEGHHTALAAVAMGARIIEKHICLDFNVSNAQDWKVSCGPHDLSDFVRQIRETEKSIGTAEKKTQLCEEAAVNWATKSLVASADLKAGTLLTKDHLVAKRPGDGIAPSSLTDIIGHRLSVDVNADDAISWDHLQK
jgi:N,N'-diacetyllegionaminate synthase